MIKLNPMTDALLEGHPEVRGVSMQLNDLTYILTLHYDSIELLYDFLAQCPKTTVFTNSSSPQEERALIGAGFQLCEVVTYDKVQSMYVHHTQMDKIPGLVTKYNVVVGYDI